MEIIDYQHLKLSHVSLVVLSYVFFCYRGLLALGGNYHPSRFFHRLIHTVDTLLLICGVSLAMMLSLNPLVISWLGAKIIALFLYVVIASLAIRLGKSFRVRLLAFVFSQAIFSYMVIVAITKSAWPLNNIV